jgi:O-antigen/teichoic acid export membrane protein
MELKILVKNSSYLILTNVFHFAVGIVRSKLIAVFLGTVGSGIISQLQVLTQRMSSFTLLGMNDGLVKLIAESKDTPNFKSKLCSLIKSYTIIVTVMLILSIFLLLFFSNKISIYIFGDLKYYNYFLIGLATLPILVLNSISIAVLKSFKKIKYIARSQVYVILIGFLFFVPLIFLWGLNGAVVSVTISFLIALIFNNFFARKKILNPLNLKIRDVFSSKVSKVLIKELLMFAGFGLTTGLYIIFIDIASRSIVITKLGIDQIGIYSPVITWSSLFISFVMPSIGTFLFPRFSEAKSNVEICGILNDALRFVTLLMIPVLLLCIPIRYQIIPLFYSKDFINAAQYLPWHFLGTLFYLWMYPFTQAMTPTGRIKIYGVLVIIMQTIDFAVVYFLTPIIGMYGWMLKFIISPTLFLIFYLIFFSRNLNFHIYKKNIILMLYLLSSFFMLIVMESYLVRNYLVNFLLGVILTGFTYLLFTKSERNLILQKLRIKK